jgi:hypothetical protein
MAFFKVEDYEDFKNPDIFITLISENESRNCFVRSLGCCPRRSVASASSRHFCCRMSQLSILRNFSCRSGNTHNYKVRINVFNFIKNIKNKNQISVYSGTSSKPWKRNTWVMLYTSFKYNLKEKNYFNKNTRTRVKSAGRLVLYC